MKILMTDNELISLENVRKVERKCHTTNHTRRGTAYSVDHYQITISYCGKDEFAEHIDCGEDAKGKAKAEELFSKIYGILMR